jgi:hypothetical protein
MFAAAERDYLATSPYRLVHEHDMRGGRYVVRAQVARPIPEELPRVAADVVRGLLNALDEIATSLAGTPVAFPIYESLALFAQRARKPISRMPDEAQATLEAVQPYHAIGGFRNGALWMLQQLGAEDPPRLAGSVRGGTMGVNTQRGVTLVGELVVSTGPFSNDAIVASAATKVAGTDPKLDMFFRPDFALAYPKEGPARGREVASLLAELCDHVENDVVAELEPSLPSS